MEYLWIKWKFPNETFIYMDIYLTNKKFNSLGDWEVKSPKDEFPKILHPEWIIDSQPICNPWGEQPCIN